MYFFGYNFIIVTHYDIGKPITMCVLKESSFWVPIKQHITKFHNVILLPFYYMKYG